MRTVFIILFLLISMYLRSQNTQRVDSLILLIENTTEDSVLVKLKSKLADEYGFLNPEKAIVAMEEALEICEKNNINKYIPNLCNRLGNLHSSISDFNKAEKYYRKSLENEQQRGNEIGAAMSKINIGTIKQNTGFYNESLDYYFEALKIFEKHNMDLEIVYCYINIGIAYNIKNFNEQALTYFLKGLKKAKTIDKPTLLGHIYLNLGVFYDTQGEMDKALECYNKQLEIVQESEDYASIANSYNNIGCVFEDKGELDKSLEYYKKSTDLWEKLKDKDGVALCYGNIAGILLMQKKYKESEEFFLKSLSIRKEIQDIVGLGDSYHKLGLLYNNTGKTQKALKYFNMAFSIRDTIDILSDKSATAAELNKIYAKIGDYKNAYKYHVLHKQYSDSLFNESSIKKITQLQMQYEFDKETELKDLEKQKREIEHKAEIETQELKNKTQSRIIFIFIFVLIIIIVFLYIVYRQYKQKKRANILLGEQNEEINQQKEEITAQRDEIEAQRDLAANQRDIITGQNNELTDSIEYAKRIQNSTLPSTEFLSQYFTDFFIFFKPRDIVSGDFYWFAEIEKHIIITAADCTGHGVPGAFMSMLGMSLLKEIVIKEYITHPGVILRRLRKEIINALHQKGDAGEQQDGMDMALISINYETKLMQYSGANNPLYIIRGGELIEYKGDKMPIAIYNKLDKFTTHEIQLQKNDIIYMFSDGFADQFGGPNGKKFKYKPFKQLLIDNSKTPMSGIKEVLNTTFENWKNNLEQVDDIIILGLKI